MIAAVNSVLPPPVRQFPFNACLCLQGLRVRIRLQELRVRSRWGGTYDGFSASRR
jgi:hypothetical protein